MSESSTHEHGPKHDKHDTGGHHSKAEKIKGPLTLTQHREAYNKSIESLGKQTSETITALLLNTFVRPFTKIDKGHDEKFAPIRQFVTGIFSSIGSLSFLVGSILVAFQKTGSYSFHAFREDSKNSSNAKAKSHHEPHHQPSGH